MKLELTQELKDHMAAKGHDGINMLIKIRKS